MRNEVSGRVAAPPEAVWAVMTDVERWPEWTKSIETLKRLDEGPLMVGSEARIKQPRFPELVWTVTDLTDGVEFIWEQKSLGVVSRGIHRVTPAEGGSEATLAVEQTGPASPLLGLFFGGTTRKYLDMELAGLKESAEAHDGLTDGP